RAEPILERVLATRRRVLGEDHPDTLSSYYSLGNLHEALNRPDAAEANYRRALDGRLALLGPDHPDTLTSQNELGALYLYSRHQTIRAANTLAVFLLYHSKQYERADQLLRTTLATAERDLARDHPDTLNTVNHLAKLRGEQGRFDEADALYDRLTAARRRADD